MAGKTQTNSASGSPQIPFFVISNYFPVRREFKITFVIFRFTVDLNYKRFRCTNNITWNAKMVAEHVGTIAKNSMAYRRYTDWAFRTWIPGFASFIMHDFFPSAAAII